MPANKIHSFRRGKIVILRMVIAAGKNDFDIPFNRQQLADYLSVDRSALSAELGKMQKEGLLRVKKNLFEIMKESKG